MSAFGSGVPLGIEDFTYLDILQTPSTCLSGNELRHGVGVRRSYTPRSLGVARAAAASWL